MALNDESIQRWRLTWEGHTWTDDDLTVADIAALIVLVGNDWEQMTPTGGPLHRMSFLSVLLARTTGEPFTAVRDRLLAAKASELAKALTVEEV